MHPGPGPTAEAEALYVRQLKLAARLAAHTGEFVVWDVGLGGAANALALLRASRELKGTTRLVSFDHSPEPLAFASRHRVELGYFTGYEAAVEQLLKQHHVEFTDGSRQVAWHFRQADFPKFIGSTEAATLAKPHAVMFDAFSPARNPEMWTLPLFSHLHALLDPSRPCALATYSRSTLVRVALLLAGFFVGRGLATGLKEETTVAANRLALLDNPLDKLWLQRAQKSGSAEPLADAVYQQAPLTAGTHARLRAHVQFR
jgi:tRNA U34 5-methylaminomethyl-2-thiouridine-forming methyltransferase MnmC